MEKRSRSNGRARESERRVERRVERRGVEWLAISSREQKATSLFLQPLGSMLDTSSLFLVRNAYLHFSICILLGSPRSAVDCSGE